MGYLARLLGWDGPLTAEQGYALWAETYPPAPHNPLMEAEQSATLPILESLSPRRALDVGTGTGRGLRLLTAAGAETAIGVDLSLPMLSRVPAAYARVQAHACHLPFVDAAFDLVCSSLMAGDIESLDEWLVEAARVLSPRGHLVYSDFHPAGTAKGWRRTFRDGDGTLHDLQFFSHRIEQHLDWLENAGFAVRTVREPRIEPNAPPLIVVVHAVKRC